MNTKTPKSVNEKSSRRWLRRLVRRRGHTQPITKTKTAST
jgi:hypothetical protein